MNFKMSMGDISQAITSLEENYSNFESGRQKISDSITALCEAGWSGDSQVAYMDKAIKWYIEAQAVINRIDSIKCNLETHVPSVDELLEAGKAMNL